MNKSENTIRTIQNCLQRGVVIWKKQMDKYEFFIKTTILESIDSSMVEAREMI